MRAECGTHAAANAQRKRLRMRKTPNTDRRDACSLSANFDASPKGDSIGDLLGLGLGLRVEPSCIGILFPVHNQRPIVGLAFPRATCALAALFDELSIEGRNREIVISLYDDRIVTLGDDRSIPYRFHTVLLFPV